MCHCDEMHGLLRMPKTSQQMQAQGQTAPELSPFLAIGCKRGPNRKTGLLPDHYQPHSPERENAMPARAIATVNAPGTRRTGSLLIAVGIPLPRYPPHRSGRALISASGSYLGW